MTAVRWIVLSCALVVAIALVPGLTSTADAAADGPTFGVLEPEFDDLAAYRDAGIKRVMLALGWDWMERSQGTINEAYVSERLSRMQEYRDAGFDVVLDLGLQYPPSWVFSLPGETRFVNQYGDRWRGPLGKDVPNAIWNPAVRDAQASYIARALQALGPDNFVAVRVGGLVYNEALYPSPVFGGHTDSYWSFDTTALERSPVPGWRPGQNNRAENEAFITFYLDSLADYESWLVSKYREEFSGEIQLLLPTWGIRPGHLEEALDGGFDGSSTAELGEMTHRGTDFDRMASRLGGLGSIVLYTTYLDGDMNGSSERDMSPVEYVNVLADRYGFGVAGENSGNGEPYEEMDRIAVHAAANRMSSVMWMSGPRLAADPGLLAKYRDIIAAYGGSGDLPGGSLEQPSARSGPPLAGSDRPGYVDTELGLWRLVDAAGNVSKTFYFGNPGDVPIVGDWDCNGSQTPGMYRQADGYVYVRNSNTQGIADIRFYFGNPGDIPLAGDFNGDGCDTVSIFRRNEGRVYIVNELGANDGGLGPAEVSYYFGNPGDRPFVGDFDGDGTDTVGLHRAATGLVYYRNSHSAGFADNEFVFGDPGDRLFAGDWVGEGFDSPGLFRPSDEITFFRFANAEGWADAQYRLGDSDWIPVAGDFSLE